ncbi:hypothetical protein ACE1ET_20370 [Saccharicrinis sp. FJH62]|uniref:hypothetical protein n=1 Tax=Saccharicrinis sp. FJH62 TaxID=3344657 RepID=UPI0035D4E0FA
MKKTAYLIIKMRIFYLYLIIGLTSCNLSIQEKDNTTDVDSIHFSLIKNSSDYNKFSIFLLKYPDSKYFDQAVNLYLVKRDNYFDSIGWPIIDCFRNCADIKIRTNGEILFEYDKIEVDDLKDSLISFLINEKNSITKPEKKFVTDLNDSEQQISMGHVILAFVTDSCEMLQERIKDISISYYAYKNYLAKSWYNTGFKDLDKIKMNHLDSLLQNRLILYRFEKEYLTPPPPPLPAEDDVLKIVDDEIIGEND